MIGEDKNHITYSLRYQNTILKGIFKKEMVGFIFNKLNSEESNKFLNTLLRKLNPTTSQDSEVAIHFVKDEYNRLKNLNSKVYFLENAEWFNFVLGEPAYCGNCEKGVKYEIKNWQAVIPSNCSVCWERIGINKGDNSKGNEIYIKHH